MKQILKVSFLAVFMLAILPFTSTQFAENIYAQSSKANPESDFDYNFNDDSTGIILTSYKGESSQIIVPAKIKKLPVVGIAYPKFNCNNTTISLLDFSKTKIKRIPVEVFKYIGTDSKNGVKIILPKSLETIGNDAFMNAKISSINFPSGLKQIGANAFYNCKFTSDPILNDKLEIIGSSAFCDSNIKSVTIPKSVAKIGLNAFARCNELSEINLPNEINFSVVYLVNGIFGLQNSENPTLYSEIFNGTMISNSFELREKLNVPVKTEKTYY